VHTPTTAPLEAAPTGRSARYDRRRRSTPTVSVIIPTFNERDNIAVLIERLAQTLIDFDYEIIVVDDDSPDRTWEVVETLALDQPRLRLLRRVGRRGLSSAVIDGMAMAEGIVLAVMDADLQHDEAVLPDLVSAVIDDGADLCLGSREAPGGSYGSFGPLRRGVSWAGATLARTVLGVAVTDPMSGYFTVSRDRFEAVRSEVNPRGFKVMLELLARGERPSVAEVGYQFRARVSGETKLGAGVGWAYLQALANLALQRTAPSRFGLFAAIAVGALTLRAGVTTLAGTLLGSGLALQLVLIEALVLLEVVLHHTITFADRRSRSRLGPRVRAAVVFHLVALHGIFALRGVGSFIDAAFGPPQPGPRLVPALALATIGVASTVITGYVVSSVLVWPWRHHDPISSDGR
jgi:dolichol-phosphate mannosyltransferase